MCHASLLSKALGQHGRAERPVCRCKGCSGRPQLLLALLPHHNLPTRCGTTSTTVCSAPCAAAALPQQRAAGVQPAPAPSLQQKPPNLLLGAEDPTPVPLETAGPNGATRDAPEPQPPLLLPVLPHPFPGFPVVEVLLEVILPQRLQLRRVNDRFHIEHPWEPAETNLSPTPHRRIRSRGSAAPRHHTRGGGTGNRLQPDRATGDSPSVPIPPPPAPPPSPWGGGHGGRVPGGPVGLGAVLLPAGYKSQPAQLAPQ